MKRVEGRNHPWGLPHILKEYGYRTLFFATSDPHFDNMQGFLMANGIETVSSLFDYDPHEKLSSMGVPDHVMFDRAVRTLRDEISQPFLAVILTGSNHGPWIIPDVPMEPIPKSEKYYDERMAFKYSDWSLGRLVRMLESDSLFDNTLVVVTADNGLPDHPVTDMDLTQYKIPLLLDWIGPEKPPPARVARLGSQMDIVATVMAQVRLDYDDYSFGRNLLDTAAIAPPFAFFSEWYKIGFIEDHYYSIIRLDGPASLYDLTDPATDIAGAQPGIADNHRRKALALYQTGYYNLQRPLHRPEQAVTKY
jgi:phosphoglycerol transferase MdoB-like AlkP superfamily enzyme